MNDKSPVLTISHHDYDAVIFDLDGVITDTASVHFSAWKKLFDGYLQQRQGNEFTPFSEDDYLKYVDGKPRYEGVKSFLQSRGIELPYGSPEDSPEQETICGLGNRKNAAFQEFLEEGVKIYDSSVQLLEQLKSAGIKIAVVTSSKNCDAVLKAVHLTDVFQAKVDGVVAAERGLEGKPAPATFLEAARELGCDPARSIVVEDAISGVQAGSRGHFGCVLGIDRTGQAEALRQNGADVVVSDLAEVAVL